MPTKPSKFVVLTPEQQQKVQSICDFSKAYFHISEQQLGELLGLGRNWKQNMFTSKKEGYLRYEAFIEQLENSSFFYNMNVRFFDIWYEQMTKKNNSLYNPSLQINEDRMEKFLEIGIRLSSLEHYDMDTTIEEMLNNPGQLFFTALQWTTVLLIHEYFLFQKKFCTLKKAKMSRNTAALENPNCTKFFDEEKLINCIIEKQPQKIKNCATKNQCCNGHYCKNYLDKLCQFNSAKKLISYHQAEILHYQNQYCILFDKIKLESPEEYHIADNLAKRIDELIATNTIKAEKSSTP